MCTLYMTCLIWRTCLQLQHLQRCKVILMASNCWLAEQNLANQPHLYNSKILLAEKYQILGQMVSSMRRKQRKLGRFSMWWNMLVIWRFFFFFSCITDVMLLLCHMQKLYNRNSALERFISFLRRRPIIPWVNLRYIWDMIHEMQI